MTTSERAAGATGRAWSGSWTFRWSRTGSGRSSRTAPAQGRRRPRRSPPTPPTGPCRRRAVQAGRAGAHRRLPRRTAGPGRGRGGGRAVRRVERGAVRAGGGGAVDRRTGPWSGWSRRSGRTRRARQRLRRRAPRAGSPYGPIRGPTTPGGSCPQPWRADTFTRRRGGAGIAVTPGPAFAVDPNRDARTRSGSGSRRLCRRIWRGRCGRSPTSQRAVPPVSQAVGATVETEGEEQPGDRAQGGGEGVVDRARGRAGDAGRAGRRGSAGGRRRRRRRAARRPGPCRGRSRVTARRRQRRRRCRRRRATSAPTGSQKPATSSTR